MQTFLPYSDFKKSLACLDYRRLGKQRVEAMQLLNAITSLNRWCCHPCFHQWAGYSNALTYYMNLAIKEWINRGYNNNMILGEVTQPIILPPWVGDDRFHSSHRAALLFKDLSHYSLYGWTEEPRINYYWPSHEDYK